MIKTNFFVIFIKCKMRLGAIFNNMNFFSYNFTNFNQIPSKYMMDQFGWYTVQDYIDVFGSYEIVENKLTKLLERVAKITEEISIEKLEKEYQRVKNEIGNVPSLLDFTSTETTIGVEYYLKTFRTFSKAVALFENKESQDYIKHVLKQDYWMSLIH